MTLDALFVTSYVVLWLLVIALVVIVVAQLHYMGVLFDALDPVLKLKVPRAKLQLRERLPVTRLVDEFGSVWDVSDVDRARVLLFVSTTCKACDELLGKLGPTLRAYRELGREPVVIVVGEPAHAVDLRARFAIPSAVSVLADPGRDSLQRLGITKTPTAIPVDAEARVESFIEAPSADKIIELLRSQSSATRPATIHAVAPAAKGGSQS